MDSQVSSNPYYKDKMYTSTCMHCGSLLNQVFCDLVNSPPSNSMLRVEQLNMPETYYPLKILVCHKCYLVQVEEDRRMASAIFDNNYAYFSSFSRSYLEHSRKYVHMMIERFEFNEKSFIVEVGSNDGYLLQYFVKKGIPVLGIDPTTNTALAAKEKGVETIVDFFGTELAKRELSNKNRNCDLILGNNVLAHVPDINDFVGGMKEAINATGIVTMEFPHIERLIEGCLFDSIYHEHFSYLSFTVVKRIFESKGLEMFDVEEVNTHGGSLRIYAKNPEDKTKSISKRVIDRLNHETQLGISELHYYQNFQSRVDSIKYDLWNFLLQKKSENKKVVGYGAAAKANTLLNYCGVKGNDLIEYCVDSSPHKQNRFLPGSHVPVVSEDNIKSSKPDYVIIFPWNLKQEIMQQLEYIREWGGEFVVFVPNLRIL